MFYDNRELNYFKYADPEFFVSQVVVKYSVVDASVETLSRGKVKEGRKRYAALRGVGPS
jgi:hypothetical protein